LDCPACRQLLIVAERSGIELDCCPGCRGLWFDATELELVVEKLGLPQVPRADSRFALAESKERPRPCPRCDRVMEKVFFDAGRSVVVDWCARGHGLWFDRGELGRVLEQLARLKSEPLGELASYLGETFRK